MPIPPSVQRETIDKAVAALRQQFRGDVRIDRLSRALYATDASIYEIVPDVVLLPRCAEDVCAAVRICGEYNIPITPRGAGTGLTGAAVNRGMQLDLSRYMNTIASIDADARLAVVEPGVVLDHLNAAVRPHGLHFAPDVATSSRATIGGMIGNNSCGAHSVFYGRTVDHVLALEVVLADGSMARWGESAGKNPLAHRCDETLRDILKTHENEIAARYPKVLRSNAGYGLDRIRADAQRLNTESLICGSEGTLAVVTRAALKLTPLPKCKGLLVVQFDALVDALSAVPPLLEHKPAAVELIDALILDAARRNQALSTGSSAVHGNPAAILVVELYDDDEAILRDRLDALQRDLRAKQIGTVCAVVTGVAEQAAVWNMRNAGLGLLMSRPGDVQPYAFVEDTAVDPSRLREYIERFTAILAEESVNEAGYYAHASVGCLHVRPVLNLRDQRDVQRMRRIAERVSLLAIEFGGTMTGEHGDGLLRSEWIERLYGPRIVEAFRRIKRTFDPQGILNPGKIVDPPPMTEHLRYGGAFEANRDAKRDTALDFTVSGGMLGLASMCSGVGQCRQSLVGTMCPSYEATRDETHTTRGRANALRLALSNRSLIDGLDDPALDEVMDLCISCKACKSECPTGVDMARLKAEWQHQKQSVGGAPMRSRLIAHTAALGRIASRTPRLANSLAQSGIVRQLADRLLGIDRRVPPPMFARQTFRAWFEGRRNRQAVRADASDPSVIYFVDTWTDLFTPQVGIATVRVLEALGFRVVVPPPICCGRPAISKGMLDVARRQLEEATDWLGKLGGTDTPIVGTEPSCLLTLTDELPQLVRTGDARNIARRAVMIESFIAQASNLKDRLQNRLKKIGPARFHGHCHQKSLVGTSDVLSLLQRVSTDATEINSGCCGMAGSFGHEREHYDVAKAIGDSRLLPAVRNRGDATIAVSGFSCRHQIHHHTGVRAKHFIELIADAMKLDASD